MLFNSIFYCPAFRALTNFYHVWILKFYSIIFYLKGHPCNNLSHIYNSVPKAHHFCNSIHVTLTTHMILMGPKESPCPRCERLSDMQESSPVAINSYYLIIVSLSLV